MSFSYQATSSFVVRCRKPAAEIIQELAKKKILVGPELDRFYKGMENCLLVAVTETRSKDDIDSFAKALEESL